LSAYLKSGGSLNYMNRFWHLVRGTEDALTLCLPFIDQFGQQGLHPKQLAESESGLPKTVEGFKNNPEFSVKLLAWTAHSIIGHNPELIGTTPTDMYVYGKIMNELADLSNDKTS